MCITLQVKLNKYMVFSFSRLQLVFHFSWFAYIKLRHTILSGQYPVGIILNVNGADYNIHSTLDDAYEELHVVHREEGLRAEHIQYGRIVAGQQSEGVIKQMGKIYIQIYMYI